MWYDSFSTVFNLSETAKEQLSSLLPHYGTIATLTDDGWHMEELPSKSGIPLMAGAYRLEATKQVKVASERRKSLGKSHEKAIVLLSDSIYIFFED